MGGSLWVVERPGFEPLHINADSIGEAVNTAVLQQHTMRTNPEWQRIRDQRAAAASVRMKAKHASGTFGQIGSGNGGTNGSPVVTNVAEGRDNTSPIVPGNAAGEHQRQRRMGKQTQAAHESVNP